MKLKTHSGAKKRLRPKPGGKVKRKQPNKRHILEKKSAKRKRALSRPSYVNDSNAYQTERLLVL